MAARKTYDARIRFGWSTDTDDSTGKMLRQAPLPRYGEHDPEQFATQLLASFSGELEQLPPNYSAIKTEGVKAYQQARKGQEVAREPRQVTVYSGELLHAEPDCWSVRFEVSKGTYIRSLARDIGEAATSAAHLESLRRVQSGGIDVESCIAKDDLTDSDSVCDAFIDPLKALGLPSIELGISDYELVSNGATIVNNYPNPKANGVGQLYTMVFGGRLLGLYRSAGAILKPEVILNGGVSIDR
jgi:tRNA pseudouridine55 synthase